MTAKTVSDFVNETLSKADVAAEIAAEDFTEHCDHCHTLLTDHRGMSIRAKTYCRWCSAPICLDCAINEGTPVSRIRIKNGPAMPPHTHACPRCHDEGRWV